MATITARSNGGIGVTGLLGVVFVTLKLLGIINWSWWWVTLPFWGGGAVILSILLFAGLLYGLAYLIETWK